jgi:hypothetical protein
MRVTEKEAKEMLCPMKLANFDADRWCESTNCMAFKEVGQDVRFDEQGADHQVTIYVCGLARLL